MVPQQEEQVKVRNLKRVRNKYGLEETSVKLCQLGSWDRGVRLRLRVD